jgi:glucose-1-phosphate adenylyltransferase
LVCPAQNLRLVPHEKVFTLLLAGGEGSRLFPLTKYRAKPAVSFGGIYRLIDFTLSNCVNSGLRRIGVLMQTKSSSLNRHLNQAWNVYRPELDEYIFPIHPTLSTGGDVFKGTADAVFQNLRMIGQDVAEVLIVSGDHIYKMDYSKMLERHRMTNAEASVAVIETDLEKASQFGVVEEDADGRIVGFEEKPARPKASPRSPGRALVSMGVYLFSRELLVAVLTKAEQTSGEVDFGRDILPQIIHRHRVMAHEFVDENKNKSVYWRDVGTVDSFWAANMDLVGVDPVFNLYDRAWPLRTYQPTYPPAKFVFSDDFPGGRCGKALDSIVSPGAIVSGSVVRRSVLSPNVCIDGWSEVNDSVLMADVTVGEHCRINRAIIDKGVTIPPRTDIGIDEAEDRRRFFVSAGGVVVVPEYSLVPTRSGLAWVEGKPPGNRAPEGAETGGHGIGQGPLGG